jgi:hypothetical protein
MKKFYFTFGQSHAHSVGGTTYDKDCVIEITAENEDEARDKMFDTFGSKWSMAYGETPPKMGYFPRGIIPLR